MGPETNPELFRLATTDSLQARLGDEAARRAWLAGALSELSEAFGGGDAARHPITEPTLPFKLAALSSVQPTVMGVAGTNPSEVIRVDRSALQVRAHAAPPHDSYYSTVASRTVHTRAVMIRADRQHDDNGLGVEFFGLNLYVADGAGDVTAAVVDQASDLSEAAPAPRSSLVVVTAVPDAEPGANLVTVDAGGRFMTPEAYIAGETPIIAVRNNQTGDAKVYALSVVPIDAMDAVSPEAYPQLRSGNPVLIDDEKAYIPLPTGQVQKIEVLKGELRDQAVAEFVRAASILKERNKVTQLSRAEQQAAREAINASRSSNT